MDGCHSKQHRLWNERLKFFEFSKHTIAENYYFSRRLQRYSHLIFALNRGIYKVCDVSRHKQIASTKRGVVKNVKSNGSKYIYLERSVKVDIILVCWQLTRELEKMSRLKTWAMGMTFCTNLIPKTFKTCYFICMYFTDILCVHFYLTNEVSRIMRKFLARSPTGEMMAI